LRIILVKVVLAVAIGPIDPDLRAMLNDLVAEVVPVSKGFLAADANERYLASIDSLPLGLRSYGWMKQNSELTAERGVSALRLAEQSG
jgi:hypothetical protein